MPNMRLQLAGALVLMERLGRALAGTGLRPLHAALTGESPAAEARSVRRRPRSHLGTCLFLLAARHGKVLTSRGGPS